MSIKIKLKKSKINFLNAQIASYHDSGHFAPVEAAILIAPLLDKVQELQEEIRELQAQEYEVVDVEALTPLKQGINELH